jgi:serpin B
MKRAIALLLPLSCAVVVAAPEKSAMTSLVAGNNRFALDMYQRLSEQEGNLFLSPYSISTALTLTSAGARGKTADEMAAVLHLLPQAEPHAAAEALRQALNADSAKKGVQLSTANALWPAKDFTVRPEFLALARKDYGAEVTNLDFAGDSEGARQTINHWVEKETQEKIKDLIARGILNGQTRLVLTNAIYFKGLWDEPFKKDVTKEETFRAANGNTPKVPMMNRTGQYGYAETEDLQALSLLYSGKELELVVLLPKHDDLKSLEKKLSADMVSGVLSKISREKVIVSLPRFKTTAQFELSDMLKGMGMPLAFGPDADFSGLTLSRERLAISKVIHKAFVDVNEEGTEAAAATAVIVTRAAAIINPKPPPVFRADHPFIHLIRDTRTGSILFLGRVNDPTR